MSSVDMHVVMMCHTTGTNQNEGSLFVPVVDLIVPGVKFPFNNTGVELILEHFFNTSTVDAVMAQYPEGAYPNNEVRVGSILTQYLFACPGRAMLYASRFWSPSTPTWSYKVARLKHTHDFSSCPL